MDRFTYLLTGFGLGVGVAMLFAPKPGAQTRSDISGKIAEGQEALKRQTAEAREAVNETVRRGAEVAERSKKAARAAYDAGKREFLQDQPVASSV